VSDGFDVSTREKLVECLEWMVESGGIIPCHRGRTMVYEAVLRELRVGSGSDTSQVPEKYLTVSESLYGSDLDRETATSLLTDALRYYSGMAHGVGDRADEALTIWKNGGYGD
jgi:hypothetical protein